MSNRFFACPRATRASSPTTFVLSAFLLISALFFASCAPAIRVTLAQDGSATATFSGSLGPAAGEALTRTSGGDGASIGLDPELIKQRLATAGISADEVLVSRGSSLFMKLSIPNVTALPGGIISRPESGNGIVITFSPESINALVDLMPVDTRDALDLLMAPIFSGERLSAAEYEDIMGAAYGKTLREELSSSKFLLSLTCPETVREARIGKPGTCEATGKIATLSIPISALLSLENPLQARILW